MSIIAVVPKQLDNNHMARLWSLGQVVEAAGHKVHMVADGVDDVWLPLRDQIRSSWSVGPRAPRDTDAVLGAVPLPGIFEEAQGIAVDLDVPLLVDCDEAHWEARHGYSTYRRIRRVVGRCVRGVDPRPPYRTLLAARRHPVIFSNPYSSALLTPAAIIPHVREFVADRPPRLDDVVVAFVGTPRPHKGIGWLREECRRRGHRLVVTADRPVDATSNEEWLGAIPQTAVPEVLARCNVVALPSRPSGLGESQLPAKAIEAMAHGMALVVADLGPMRWALADAARYFPAGDRAGFAAAMEWMTPARAERLGAVGLDRARRLFTPQAQAGTLRALLAHAGRR